MQDGNNESVVVPSILVAKEEEIAHIENDAHATKLEGKLYFDRNIVVHYNQKNMVHVQESHLYLPEAMIFMLI